MEGGAAAALTSSCDVVAVDNPQELDLDNEDSVSSSISLLPLLRVLFLARTLGLERELSRLQLPHHRPGGFSAATIPLS